MLKFWISVPKILGNKGFLGEGVQLERFMEQPLPEARKPMLLIPLSEKLFQLWASL